MQVYSTN